MTAFVAAVAVVGGLSADVDAHSDVEFTLPTEGASVAEPITEIAIGFTQPVTLIGPGFEVLDPQGNLVVPFVVTDDDQVFRLQIDPPMGGGDVGVRYEVTAQDGHVISGSFSFTVSVPAPTTAPTTAPATTPTTTLPVTTAPPSSTAPEAAPATAPVGSTVAPAATIDPIPSTPAPPTSAAPDDAADDGDNTGLYIAIALALAVGAIGFLGIRRSAIR
jgi:methionine-rich copper-binding protein CopC